MSSTASWADFLGLNPYEVSTEVRFKDRFDDQFYGHLGHPVPYGRDTQGTLSAVAFGYHDALYRVWCIGLALQCFFQLRQKGDYPFSGLYGLEGDAVDAGAPFVGSDKIVGVTEDVGPVYLVVQGVEAVGRFLLGLAVELPL